MGIYNVFFYSLLFVFGSIIGSFLNVVIIRVRNKESFLAGRSYCPVCKNKLSISDLFPIASFLFLKGSCRYCKNKISLQYPMVEFFTGFLFLLSGIYWMAQGQGVLYLISYLVFAAFTVLIFVYDFKWQIIPDRFSLPAIAIILILNFFAGVSVYSMAIGAAIAGGFFLLQFLISKGRWIGGGDIRLGALIGVALGFQKTILALLISYVLGAVISLILIYLQKKKMDSEIAFGTFLICGSFAALFFGNFLISYFFNI